MTYRFSLHRTLTSPKRCHVCDGEIPARKRPDYAEYWRVAGGKRSDHAPRVICCLCHALLGLPTDGWENSADGLDVVTARTPFSPSASR